MHFYKRVPCAINDDDEDRLSTKVIVIETNEMWLEMKETGILGIMRWIGFGECEVGGHFSDSKLRFFPNFLTKGIKRWEY